MGHEARINWSEHSGEVRPNVFEWVAYVTNTASIVVDSMSTTSSSPIGFR